MTAHSFDAVLWDFGGVILTSPFEAFNRYERERGLPADFLRAVNAVDPDTNAWARFERSEISAEQFDVLFAVESERRGHRVPGADVLALLHGDLRPEMVVALDRVRAAGLRTACLTNNVAGGDGQRQGSEVDADPSGRTAQIAAVMSRFDIVVESSKVGVRKPEVRFYELSCSLLGVTPGRCVFLDDLGVNLKPAAAMGMHTIKVLDAAQALDDLERALGLPLR